MTKDIGRVGGADQALVASDGAASASPPSGDHPSRLHGDIKLMLLASPTDKNSALMPTTMTMREWEFATESGAYHQVWRPHLREFGFQLTRKGRRWREAIAMDCPKHIGGHMTTNREALLPCPFCDANDAALSEPPVPWPVICGTCGAEGPYADKRKDAVAAWNTRTPPSEPSEALRRAAETGLEYIIEAANERRKKDAVFDNIMRDLKRVEAALKQPEQEKEGTK